MVDYARMYAILFNAITDASQRMTSGRYDEAKKLLDEAQLKTEDIYIEEK